MPNIWTHNLFGEAAAERAAQPGWLSRTQDRQLFRLGCQGPDFLFYHHFLPWKKKSALNELGSRMHSEACGPALMQMADIAAAQRTGAQDPLTIYVAGFMMHHVLDRNMHPYIFCKSGSKPWDHQRFEVIVDTLVVRKLLGIETWRTPVWKQIDIGEAFPPSVTSMLQQVAADHYPELAKEISEDSWNAAYRDMIRAQRMFHDPYGIKRVLTLGKIEPLVYKRRNRDLDYLNESRTRWRHPALEHESSTLSFWDMWEQAMDDADQMLAAAFRYWSDPSEPNRSALESAVGNRSYEHGCPLEEGLAIRFEEPIW